MGDEYYEERELMGSMIRLLAVILALAAAGCRSNMWDTSPYPVETPLNEMVRRSARGEHVCIRQGAVVSGPANCRR